MELEATNAALKEWAVVCRALEAGGQTLLIRKGGIEEVKQGFEVTHRAFWLFPTYIHQKPADLVAEARADFEAAQAARPPEDSVRVGLFATVSDVVKVLDLERLRGLEGQHILSRDCVASRFHYRNKPGVHVLTLRVYRRPEPLILANTARYDGCVSWVDLDQPQDPAECTPVLPDAEFGRRAAEIRRLLGT
jgi:hypothetical protein